MRPDLKQMRLRLWQDRGAEGACGFAGPANGGFEGNIEGLVVGDYTNWLLWVRDSV